MGVRSFGDAKVFAFGASSVIRPLSVMPAGPRLTRNTSGMPSLEFIYDGTSGKNGCPDALPADTAWFDPMCLQRTGTNLGITIGYNGGAGTATLYGCMLPRDYANRVFNSDGASLVTEATTFWDSLGVASPGTSIQVGFGVYTLMQVVFAGGYGGCLIASR